MNITGYIFVEKSDAEKQEIAQRQHELHEYAVGRGLVIHEFVVERGVSVKRPFRKRPQGRRILIESKAGDIVITGRAEWILGSAREGLRLVTTMEEKNVSLYCLDLDEDISLPQERKLMVYEGGAGLTRKLLMALAVCESSSHGESIKAAKKRMREDGKYIGGPVPFGWRVRDGFLRRDGEQQKIIRRIEKLRGDRWSYRDIAAKLKENHDVHLSHEGIRKILQNNDKLLP